MGFKNTILRFFFFVAQNLKNLHPKQDFHNNNKHHILQSLKATKVNLLLCIQLKEYQQNTTTHLNLFTNKASYIANAYIQFIYGILKQKSNTLEQNSTTTVLYYYNNPCQNAKIYTYLLQNNIVKYYPKHLIYIQLIYAYAYAQNKKNSKINDHNENIFCQTHCNIFQNSDIKSQCKVSIAINEWINSIILVKVECYCYCLTSNKQACSTIQV
eukprot:TRINITY_DN12839_c0_g1_i1.p3 TRINITY_DN12839_c0_g1~~TRINITY_DN12839_c0_g1_i1.p3  ORF type:complete len:213 (-),score=-10.18 TRINITY_DN12839_c0_g1_i1:340-978(-)